MIKLKHILMESRSRLIYEDSIQSTLNQYKVTKSKKDDSVFTTFTIKDGRGNLVGEFCRFVSNNQLNQVEGFNGPVYEMIRNHDILFAKKNKLKLKS